MVGIFYFTGTGNSLDIASKLQFQLGGQLCNIATFNGDIAGYHQVILVSPVYSFGLPIPVEEFLEKYENPSPLHIVLNYGGFTGSAMYYAYKYARENNWKVYSVHKMRMPVNFTLFAAPPQFMIDGALNKAASRSKVIADKIMLNKKARPHRPLFSLDWLHRFSSMQFEDFGSSFNVTESCVFCRKCINNCPTKNIRMELGLIKFDDKCVACLACYHGCPQKAINYKKITLKKPRYQNPNVKL